MKARGTYEYNKLTWPEINVQGSPTPAEGHGNDGREDVASREDHVAVGNVI